VPASFEENFLGGEVLLHGLVIVEVVRVRLVKTATSKGRA